MADLRVPVLVQATPDTPGRMTIADRRDSFCGKMSVCNNLTQYRIPYSITRLHTEAPDSEAFRADLAWFAAVCRVVRGLRRLRIGAIGARPAAFNTVRYSEKTLESHGISVETIDLSEILGRINRMPDAQAADKLAAIKKYVPTGGVPDEPLMKMAKLGTVIDKWMADTECSISAIQCWTSLEEFFGVAPCTIMSMMSENLMSSACEVDIAGVLGMHALQLASETPSALLDWNNNYGEDPDKAVCFHCSNLPKHFFKSVKMDFQQIIAGSVGRENTYGTCEGLIKAGAMSFARLSTDDRHGAIHGYLGEGEFTSDPLTTFGGAGVVRISNLQGLLRFICEMGFENITSRPISRLSRTPCRKQPAAISATPYTDTNRGNTHVHSCRRRFRNAQRSRLHLRLVQRPAGRCVRRVSAEPQEGRSRLRDAIARGPHGGACESQPGGARSGGGSGRFG